MKTLLLAAAATLGAFAMLAQAEAAVHGVPVHGTPIHGIISPHHPHCLHGVIVRHHRRYCVTGIHGIILHPHPIGIHVNGVAGPGHVGPVNGIAPEERRVQH